MNIFQLNQYGVQNMSIEETRKYNGGSLVWIVVGVIVVETVIIILGGINYHSKFLPADRV